MIRAELARQATGKAYLWLLGVGLGFLILGTVLYWTEFAPFGAPTGGDAITLTDRINASVQEFLLYALILGGLLGARDFETKFAVRQSWLAGGAMHHLGAKALVAGILFATMAAIAAVFALLITVGLFFSGGGAPEFASNSLGAFAGAFVTVLGYGYIGFFLGWATRSSLVTLLVTLIYTLVLETLIFVLRPDIVAYLPGGASRQISLDPVLADALPLAGAYAVFLGWVALFGLAALFRTQRSDVGA